MKPNLANYILITKKIISLKVSYVNFDLTVFLKFEFYNNFYNNFLNIIVFYSGCKYAITFWVFLLMD